MSSLSPAELAKELTNAVVKTEVMESPHSCDSKNSLQRVVTTLVLSAQAKKKLRGRLSQHFLPKSVRIENYIKSSQI